METAQDKYQHDGQEYSAGVFFDEITSFGRRAVLISTFKMSYN